MAEQKTDEFEIRRLAEGAIAVLPELIVVLSIGGLINPLARHIELAPKAATQDEMIQLYRLIDALNRLSIEASDFNLDERRHYILKCKLDDFLSIVVELMHLNCLKHQKSTIHRASCEFLEQMLEHIQVNPIKIGLPGYPAYLRQLQLLDVVIRDVRHALIKSHLNLHDSDHPLLNPFDGASYSFGSLPQSIFEFSQSIQCNRTCMTKWIGYLAEYNDDLKTLSNYASQKSDEIRSLSTEHPVYAAHIVNQLKQFTNYLAEHHVNLFGLNILSDIAFNANSPVRDYHRRMRQDLRRQKSSYELSLDLLKEKADALSTTNHFNKDFKAFQALLSSKFLAHPDKKQFLLGELQAYINQNHRRKNHATIFLTYIDRCIARLIKPLPQHISDRYPVLQSEYAKPTATERQQRKLRFIDEWIKIIHDCPEKSYHQSYREALNQVDQTTKKMLNENIYTFFAMHRFKFFVRDLLASDISEESVERRANRRLTK